MTGSKTKSTSKALASEQENIKELWSILNGTTWKESDHWTGKGLTFFEDTNGLKKCLAQIYGSGVYVTSSSFVYIALKGNKTIDLGIVGYLPGAGAKPDPKFFTNFKLTPEGELTDGKRILKLNSRTPIVYNRKGPVSIESLRAVDFDAGSLQK